MAQLININSTEFRRCNLSAIQSGGTWANIFPEKNEIILISTANALTADGSGECDAYIKGDGATAASALPLKSVDGVSQLQQEVDELDVQINGESGGEIDVTPSFIDGEYKRVGSNNAISTSTAANLSTIVLSQISSGEVYLFSNGNSIDAANYRSYFIFAVSDILSAIPVTDIPNYVTEIDNVNHIFRIVIPNNANKFFSACLIGTKGNVVVKKIIEPTLGLVSEVENINESLTEIQEDIQDFNDGNFAVSAKQIDGSETEIGTEDYTISFNDGEYKRLNSNSQISSISNASLSTIIVPAVAGDVVLLKLTLSVDAENYRNYFIFAVSDTVGAVSSSQLSNYVQVEDAENHIYRLTCPSGTTKIFSTCGTADKSVVWAKKAIFKKELKWLEVNEDNFNDDAVTAIVGQTLITLEDNGKKYHLWDSIKKKYDFAGKKLIAFGDSITSGVSSPGLVTITDCYIKLFCDYAGISNLTNRAISGQPLVYVGNGYSIYERVLSFNGVADVIVIAGGTNDWNQGKPLGTWGDSDNTTVYGALKGICEYLQTNYPNAFVVFITPIPYTKPASAYPDHIAPLNEYRSAIYDVATYYGYSVVSGLDLGMPREQGGWNNTMCDDADGCHPTARGHALYARSLAGKLL